MCSIIAGHRNEAKKVLGPHGGGRSEGRPRKKCLTQRSPINSYCTYVVIPVCPPCVVSTGDSMTIVTTVVGVPGGGTEGIRAPSVMVTVMRVGEGLKPPGRKGDCGARASG